MFGRGSGALPRWSRAVRPHHELVLDERLVLETAVHGGVEHHPDVGDDGIILDLGDIPEELAVLLHEIGLCLGELLGGEPDLVLEDEEHHVDKVLDVHAWLGPVGLVDLEKLPGDLV